MADQSRFLHRYAKGETPWEIGRPDGNLVASVREHGLSPGRALEVGSGTGDNAIWLARQGFSVVACELSPLAVEQAQTKARAAGVAVDFRVLDFLHEDLNVDPFDFALDRGCFHSFHHADDRYEVARRIASNLVRGGIWWSLIGNADDDDTERDGPPRLRASEIAVAVEDHFEILSLRSGIFENDRPPPPRGWVVWMRRRD